MSTSILSSVQPSQKTVSMSTSVVPSGESSCPSWILLHACGQIGKILNHTTAEGWTRDHKTISVSLLRERPPRPSNLYVDCTDGILRNPPEVICMVDDLILFHVYVGSECSYPMLSACDFFIYRASTKQSSLKLLPHPEDRFYGLSQVGIVPRDDDRYTIAALVPERTYKPNSFILNLLDSDAEDWTSRALHVEVPQEDFLVKIPMELHHLFYHRTSSVITNGGTIGWVDLYRGIVFCDILGGKLASKGVPLPLPFKQMEDLDPVFTYPCYTRGISFTKRRLRLVHLDFNIIELDGHDKETGWPSCRMESWMITMWSNTEFSNLYGDWQKDCTLQASAIAVGDYTESELPLSLPDGTHDEAEVEQRGLQNLFVSDPCFDMNASDDDGDIIYLTARVKFLHPESWVLAIDMKNQKVHSVVKSSPLPAGPPPIDGTYCTCSISKCSN